MSQDGNQEQGHGEQPGTPQSPQPNPQPTPRASGGAVNPNGDSFAPDIMPPRPIGMEPSWDQMQMSPSWRILRIMSEFVDGFTFLARIQRSVTIFGSARLPQTNPYYQMARELAKRLAQSGYTIVTGGGPGIMEAANRGASEVGGDSVGLNIQLPHEQRMNPYVKRSFSFHYFFSRKVMLDYSAEAYIFFPGGFGTLDEFFELVTLIQTGKMNNAVPILLMGTAFWQGLCDWMQQELLERLGAIAPDDLRIWTLTDDIDQAVSLVRRGIQAQVEQQIAEKGHAVKTPDEKVKEATQPMSGSEQ